MELYYQRYGDEGPPLIILHGLLGASGNWHTLSRNVFSEHFQVFAVDQRNHGRSPHADRFDYEVMADDMKAFMEQHGLSEAHLLGHSMGGKTAMHVALQHPEKVDRLIVVDMAPKAYPPHHEQILEALRGLDLSTFDSREEIDAALAEEISSKPVRQFLLKNLSYDGEGDYTWQMNLEGIYQSYDEILAGIDTERTFDGPALFVRGETSDYVTEEDLPRIRKNFPQAELRTVKGAGHWVHADQPEAFAEVVMEFLSG